MEPSPSEAEGRNGPDAFFRLIQQQTQASRSGNGVVILMCAVFVVVCALLVVSLELGADIEQLLLGAFVVATVNLVLGVGWIAAGRHR